LSIFFLLLSQRCALSNAISEQGDGVQHDLWELQSPRLRRIGHVAEEFREHKVEEQNTVNEELRKLRQAFVQRRSRATRKGDEQKKWQAEFDIERLSKGGGLIDPCEKAPFIDCRTPEEHLHTARIFAFAFRHARTDCPDIQPDETIDRFIFRVHKLWYSKPKGQVMFFVGLRTLRFDDDMGMRREEFDFDSEWEVLPGHDVTVDIAVLQPIGKEPEVPEWEKGGFTCYSDWRDHNDEEQRKKKNREQLDKYLASHPEVSTALAKTEDSAPQLRYQGIIIEH
jgi:hypothetical protein